MKKSWRGYTIIDLILICSAFITIITLSIIYKSSILVIFTTLLGSLSVFTLAKGKIISQFVSIVYYIFYIIICLSQHFYGEAILYIFIMLPISLYGAIEWLAHKNKQRGESVVTIRRHLSKKEWTIFAIIFALISPCIYFILKALGTRQIATNTLSFLTMLPAVYLLSRRYRYNQIAFLINDFVVPILWIVLIMQGDLSLIPMCIYHIFQIIYDIYGIIEWQKLG